MPYLFGIVLCFTFLATLKYWERTKPEREERVRRAKEEAEAEKKAAEEKAKADLIAYRICVNGWHPFSKWEDDPVNSGYQIRHCNKCGERDRRRG